MIHKLYMYSSLMNITYLEFPCAIRRKKNDTHELLHKKTTTEFNKESSHQQKYLAAYVTDQNSDRSTRVNAFSQAVENLCNL